VTVLARRRTKTLVFEDGGAGAGAVGEGVSMLGKLHELHGYISCIGITDKTNSQSSEAAMAAIVFFECSEELRFPKVGP
jgi:hypothetical protein